jgi:hypothetical protein
LLLARLNGAETHHQEVMGRGAPQPCFIIDGSSGALTHPTNVRCALV